MRQIVFLALFLSSISSFSKDLSLIPYRVGDKWGYCDKNEKIIIKPKFERTYWFSDNGLARIKVKKKYGFIDKEGKIIIAAKFKEASNFSFSGALVVLKGVNYCLNEKGELEKTEAKHSFDCFCTVATASGEDICTNCCTPFEYQDQWGIVCQTIKYIDNEFKTMSYDSIPAQYDTIYSSIGYSNKFTPLIARKNKKFGIVDTKNNIRFDFKYDSIKVLSYNVFLLKKEGEWTLRDTSRILYSGIKTFKSYIFYSGYYVAFEKDDNWGVVNAKGVEIITPKFENIELPSRYIIQREFTVKQDGKWGYISDKGNIAPLYDELEPFNGYEYTLVMKNGKYGYINRGGKEYFKN